MYGHRTRSDAPGKHGRRGGLRTGANKVKGSTQAPYTLRRCHLAWLLALPPRGTLYQSQPHDFANLRRFGVHGRSLKAIVRVCPDIAHYFCM